MKAGDLVRWVVDNEASPQLLGLVISVVSGEIISELMVEVRWNMECDDNGLYRARHLEVVSESR